MPLNGTLLDTQCGRLARQSAVKDLQTIIKRYYILWFFKKLCLVLGIHTYILWHIVITWFVFLIMAVEYRKMISVESVQIRSRRLHRCSNRYSTANGSWCYRTWERISGHAWKQLWKTRRSSSNGATARRRTLSWLNANISWFQWNWWNNPSVQYRYHNFVFIKFFFQFWCYQTLLVN